ncbi:Epimerase domain-containing protein [Fusarium sp. LHS14.1]|nr:Epimerase domain-containing protein [Fusarium sp. LHS14.1]
MALFNISKPTVPLGSWVVVTGVSGLVGSHVADQALRAGFRVRGTTRSTEKNAWVKQHFQKAYGVENFELLEVPDMVAKGAFEKVVAGASGFIHVAIDTAGSVNAHLAIENVVDAAINGIEAAAKEPTMKRFVYTSSSYAATFPSPNEKVVITTETFNDEAATRAKLPDPEGDIVYAASKVEAERQIMAWVKENKPDFVVNTVLPNANIGPVISSAHQGYPTSSRWVKALCGDYDVDFKIPAQHFVNVQDDARLHCIALAHPSIEFERVFAVAGPVKSNAIIGILSR